MNRVIIRPRIQIPLLVVVFAAFAIVGVSLLTAGNVVAERKWFGIAMGIVCIAAGVLGVWRALRLGMIISVEGVRIRHFDARDQVILWSEIESIDCGVVETRGGLPIYAPILKRTGTGPALPSLRSLGSYASDGANRRADQLRSLMSEAASSKLNEA